MELESQLIAKYTISDGGVLASFNCMIMSMFSSSWSNFMHN